MIKTFKIILIATAFSITGCSNSFFAAQDYFTGPVQGIGIKPTTTITSGGSEQLSPVVIPAKTANKAVTYKSSDTSIVSVDENTGLIYGAATVLHGATPPTAVITVTTVEGGFTATCTVTVVEKPVAVTGVTLNKNSTAIETTKTETLTPVFIPSTATNQAVTWSSDNTTVAKVDSTTGVITALANGTANITVKTTDGGYTATCKVTVTTDPVAVQSISINKTSTILAVGGSETLFISFSPTNATNQNITWTSSNSAVAAYDAFGNITGKSEGTAEITATAVDTTNGTKTVKATVYVTATPVSVVGLSLSSSTGTINAGSQSKLTATITPSGATNQNITWISSNSAIATVDSSGIVTALTEGTVTITATTQDGNFSKNCIFTVSPPPTYTVSYDGNGSTGGVVPVADAATDGSTVIVKGNIGSPVLEKSGKTFIGWNTNKNATTASLLPGDSVEINSSNIVLYAIWTNVPTYTLTYDGFMNTSGSAPTDTTPHVAGIQITLPTSGTLKRKGYRFAGWFDGIYTYSPGTYYTMPSYNVTLYAKWELPRVYVCGVGSTNQYWIDGTGCALNLGGRTLAPSAYSIFVSDGDIYIAGLQWNETYAIKQAVYYKNNSPIYLTYNPGATGSHYMNTYLYVSGSSIYLTGWKTNLSGNYPYALSWATTTSATDPPSEGTIEYTEGYQYLTRTTSIIKNGSDLYITGCDEYDNTMSTSATDTGAVYWKNGTRVDLSGVIANAIAISGTDVFVAGVCEANALLQTKSCYWKNGTRFIFDSTQSANNSAKGIAIYNGYVHVVGSNSQNKAFHWIRAVDAISSDSGTYEFLPGGSTANSIFIYENGDIYIAGTDGTNAMYWKNGTQYILPGGSAAHSIFVQ